jgi:mannose-binding lectin 2
MAMVGDGRTPYDKANDGKANEFAGCSARGIRGTTQPVKMRITYWQDKFLKLELQYKDNGEWQKCFEKENPPVLPSVTYLGVSAETGELSDAHDVISIVAKNLYAGNAGAGAGIPRPGQAASQRYNKDMRVPRKKGGGWGWFFFKIILFVLGVGGVYVGYTAWRTQQRRSHRF